MTVPSADLATLTQLDAATRDLVRLAAHVTAGNDEAVRSSLSVSNTHVPPVWVEELLLQSYLFAGFPRALNAMREWRRISGVTSPSGDDPAANAPEVQWRARGEQTCALVYGDMYSRLRDNVRRLHPALDSWMVVEGYGKVLSHEGLDLKRRELCIVASCAAANQDRQLLSHLHGAVNVGV